MLTESTIIFPEPTIVPPEPTIVSFPTIIPPRNFNCKGVLASDNQPADYVSPPSTIAFEKSETEMELLKLKVASLEDMVSALQEIVVVLTDKAGIDEGTAGWKIRMVRLNARG